MVLRRPYAHTKVRGVSISEKQLAANRTNARKSTGPRSIDGKSTSRSNAIRHGLFSERSLIDGEDPQEFDNLIGDLQSALSPVGSIEFALIEKIALTMWRQRRLADAEAAAIRLRRRLPKVAEAVSSEMDLGFGNDLKSKDLVPFDGVQEKWCRGVMDEYEELEEIDLATLSDKAPLIFKQLKGEAENEQETIEELVGVYDYGLTGYVENLIGWCRKQIRKAEKRPGILALAEQVRARSQILDRHELELLARYQTTLDNQLFKALKALRDAQEWRFKTIESELAAITASEIAR